MIYFISILFWTYNDYSRVRRGLVISPILFLLVFSHNMIPSYIKIVLLISFMIYAISTLFTIIDLLRYPITRYMLFRIFNFKDSILLSIPKYRTPLKKDKKTGITISIDVRKIYDSNIFIVKDKRIQNLLHSISPKIKIYHNCDTNIEIMLIDVDDYNVSTSAGYIKLTICDINLASKLKLVSA